MKLGPAYWILAAAMAAIACHRVQGGPTVAPPQSLPATVEAAHVTNEAFGRAVHAILYSNQVSGKRLSLLAGVVQQQLNRAAKRFETSHRAEGLASVRGALLLVRAGESRASMWQNGSAALEAAANEIARGGNEGQAYALYSLLLKSQAKSGSLDEARRHLEAIRAFDGHNRNHGPVETAGNLQRVTTHRALLDPSTESLNSASTTTLNWIRTALHSDVTERFAEASFDREEAVEAFRAIRSGAATIAAIFLRHGDPLAALEFLEQNDLGRVIPAPLRDRLEHAAMGGDVQAYHDLFRLFESATEAEEPETAIDSDIAAGAAFGVAVELYRRAPESVSAAGPLATLLVEYGMSEAVPYILIPALGKNPNTDALAFALEIVEHAMVACGQVSEVEGARQLYLGAAPILSIAEQPRLLPRFQVKVARLRFLLGAIETREGNLTHAEALLRQAAKGQSNLETWSLLAQVERQLGDVASALESLARQIEVCREKANPYSEAEALVSTYELEQQRGQPQAAAAALERALKRALDARQSARTPAEQSRAERTLARVLELFGDQMGAVRALNRALDAGRSDSGQFTASVLETSRMALTHGDLNSAKIAVREAKLGGLMPEDEVYVGTWLRILERQKHDVGDGTVEDVLGNLDDISMWPARLRAWTLGQIEAKSLSDSAATPAQRTEALFYRAMQSRIDGNSSEFSELLQQVVRSPSVELVELTIARDLLRAAAAQPAPKLPTSVTLP
jgi:tetratricopeptide (TPR) repeat protein